MEVSRNITLDISMTYLAHALMLHNKNTLCCSLEKSPHIFSTPQTAVALRFDLSNTPMAKLAKAVKSQQNIFHGLAHFSIKNVVFALHLKMDSNACRLEAAVHKFCNNSPILLSWG